MQLMSDNRIKPAKNVQHGCDVVLVSNDDDGFCQQLS